MYSLCQLIRAYFAIALHNELQQEQDKGNLVEFEPRLETSEFFAYHQTGLSSIGVPQPAFVARVEEVVLLWLAARRQGAVDGD